MKKNSLFLFLIALVLCGCNNDEDLSKQRSNVPLATEAKFIKLSDDNSEIAGELIITSTAKMVNVVWNTEEICNLNTTQTVVEMKNGRGTLPIKWQGKSESGAYGPEHTAYKAGVLLTTGEDAKYVPLVWADRVDSVKLETSIPFTRSANEVLPRVAQIIMTPTTVRMNYETGGGMAITLQDVPFVIFDTSEITSDLNIDISQIPEIITASQYIPIKWTAAGAPAYGFTVNFIAMAEGVIQNGIITYAGGQTPGGLMYVNSNLPAANIPANGGTYTFTFEGTYTGNVQVRALADGGVVATGTGVANKQPSVIIPANGTGAYRNITFQYKLDTGNWINLPVTTNRVQDYTGGGGGIVVAGYTWAPANLTKVDNVFRFHATQSQYSGLWNGGDYLNWNVLDVYTYTTSMTYWDNTRDPCRQVLPAGTWRTPSAVEMEALAGVTNSWGYMNGVAGRYFGTNNELFLPAAGWRENRTTVMNNKNVAALYWTSTASTTGYAYALGIQNNNIRVDNLIPRTKGISIRCISAQ